ncbi:hypothetical protein BD779DRAFT_1662291 [Infundibulicybe gibba]|nr:hypothetical protein BD779DRAFT_1662291 [Infundibulicybe gibba]
MFTNYNPFSGWAEAGGGQSTVSPWNGNSNPPPQFLARSLIRMRRPPIFPNLFNCTVVGPQSQTYFRIVTDDQMPGYTVFKDAKGRSVALIEWQTHPFQNIRNWLRLTLDQSCRTMKVGGMSYTWAPRDKSINLYAGNPSTLSFLASISRDHGAVVVKMTTDAMQLGLLDPVIVAALLLQCGKNID